MQSGTAAIHVKGAVTENFDDTQTTSVIKNVKVQSTTAKIVIDGKTEITLHSGDSLIVMKEDGAITISGKTVTIVGTQEVKTGVGAQTVTCNPQQVQVNRAGINATAVGVHEISGALVKIN